MATQAAAREEKVIELEIEMPLVIIAPQRFRAEKLEEARARAQKIKAAYPNAKVRLHWVKRTVVGNMKDVANDSSVNLPRDRVVAPLPARNVVAMEPNAIELERPPRGSWAR